MRSRFSTSSRCRKLTHQTGGAPPAPSWAHWKGCARLASNAAAAPLLRKCFPRRDLVWSCLGVPILATWHTKRAAVYAACCNYSSIAQLPVGIKEALDVVGYPSTLGWCAPPTASQGLPVHNRGSAMHAATQAPSVITSRRTDSEVALTMVSLHCRNYTFYLAGGVDLFPLKNAAVVQSIIDAGAIIIGKTNIPEFSRCISDALTALC